MYNDPVVTFSATTPRPRIRNIEEHGGNAMPSPAFPDTIVALSCGDQLDFTIQGMVTAPTAAALPDPEPEIRPINALANVEMYPAPPGIRPNVEFRMSTMRFTRPVLVMTNAMNTKASAAYTVSCVAAKFRLLIMRSKNLPPPNASTTIQPTTMASPMFRFILEFQKIIAAIYATNDQMLTPIAFPPSIRDLFLIINMIQKNLKYVNEMGGIAKSYFGAIAA